MEKYIEDARQEEKDVPDLLGAIMRPTDPVKEELRPNLMKLNHFRPKITKIRVSSFWIPEIQCFPAGGQCQASRLLGFKQFSPNNGPPNPNKSNKCWFLAPLGLVTLVALD